MRGSHVCSGRAMYGTRDGFPCSYPATVWEDGKWWCIHHFPSKRKPPSSIRTIPYRCDTCGCEMELDVQQDQEVCFECICGKRCLDSRTVNEKLAVLNAEGV